jgi:hypothetical protein
MQAKRVDTVPPGTSFSGGWENTRRRQLTLGLSATPAQRLQWLEQMMLIALRSGALDRHRRRKLALGISRF